MRYAWFLLLCFLQLARLSGQENHYVQISIPVVCMRAAPSHSSELVSQAILGTPMKVLEREGEWWKLLGPDGYEGYVVESGFTPVTEKELTEWKDSSRFRVTADDEARVYIAPDINLEKNTLTTLVNGSIVSDANEEKDGFVKISLPDGRSGYILKDNITSLSPVVVPSAEKIIDTCYALMGTPYLWGGCSTKSMDCSGLVRIVYFDQGILLPRDAKDQFNIGIPVEGEFMKGDLLFFSSTPEGGITHVAIYDSDGQYVHCSGMVKRNRMVPDDADFSKRFFRGARRILNESGSSPYLLRNNTFYFNR